MYKEKITVKLYPNIKLPKVGTYFHTKLSDIGQLKVEWGDGHTSHYNGDDIDAEHHYHSNAKQAGESFEVIIECEGCIFEYFDTAWESVEDIDFRESSLEILRLDRNYDDYRLPIKKFKGIKDLVITYNHATILDFSNTPQLEYLDCFHSKVQRLLLSNCDNFKELDCSYCYNLRDITLSNTSQLSKITISPDQEKFINKQCWEHIQEIIKKNNGTIELYV